MTFLRGGSSPCACACALGRGRGWGPGPSPRRAHRPALVRRYRNFRTFTSPRPTQFSCVAVDTSGEVVAAGAQDSFEIFIWSMQTGRLLDVRAADPGGRAPGKEATSRDGQHLARRFPGSPLRGPHQDALVPSPRPRARCPPACSRHVRPRTARGPRVFSSSLTPAGALRPRGAHQWSLL